jgi:thymidine phosphorylase
MLPQEIIRAVRDGHRVGAADISSFVSGMVDGRVTEGQAAAFAMAVYFKGLHTDDAVALTLAMRDSGTVLRWELDGPVVDKHSTGGVGDTVSLMLAPMVAACGGYVPMISGRGLGHTGGTYDKMESIPGYVAAPTMAKFRSTVGKVGCAIIGQTADLAPADKRLYGIRDVTATVESVPLITASILSKKLAAGLDALVMDVKTGNGAFMPTLSKSRTLASSIVSVANGADMPTRAIITDMNQPLTRSAGNALEVAEAIDYLTGTRREPRLHDVTMALCSEMLVLAKLAPSPATARAMLQRVLDTGEAAAIFGTMVAALGGPKRLIEQPWKHLEVAPLQVAVAPTTPGIVTAIDTRAVGMVVVALGGGRTRPQDPVDHAVGLTQLAAVGERVDTDRPLGIVHARTQQQVDSAAQLLRAAYKVGRAAPAHASASAVIERITA